MPSNSARAVTSPSTSVADTAMSSEQIAKRNRRIAQRWCVYTAAPLAVVVGVVLMVVSPIIGGVAFVLVLVALPALLWRAATKRALALVAAGASADVHPRVTNVTEGLCATFGLRMPQLLVVNDPVPNACSVGTDANNATIVTTSALVELLDLVELEGVIAHELAHIKRLDIARASVALGVVLPWATMSGGSGLVHRAMGIGREFEADKVGSITVRYPPGLLNALTKIGFTPVPNGSRFTERKMALGRWCWINPTVSGPNDRPTLDDLAVRCAVLAEA